MANKVTQAVNNFQSKAIRPTPAYEPSKAEAMGLNPPALTDAQLSGYAVLGALAASRTEAQAAAHAKYVKERAEYEAAKDAALYAKILARRIAV
jgi:hypothetical protein